MSLPDKKKCSPQAYRESPRSGAGHARHTNSKCRAHISGAKNTHGALRVSVSALR